MNKFFLEKLNNYIEKNYLQEEHEDEGIKCIACECRDFDFKVEPTFSENVLRIIDKKGFNDVEVYKKAGLSRQSFSSIRSNKQYKPHKMTAMAMCVALELDVDEADDLLNTAGYSFSRSSLLDVIVKFYIENKIYDLMEINDALYEKKQPTFTLN